RLARRPHAAGDGHRAGIQGRQHAKRAAPRVNRAGGLYRALGHLPSPPWMVVLRPRHRFARRPYFAMMRSTFSSSALRPSATEVRPVVMSAATARTASWISGNCGTRARDREAFKLASSAGAYGSDATTFGSVSTDSRALWMAAAFAG